LRNFQYSVPHGQRPAGFTLIELIVVTAILGVVIGVIGACLAGGIRVWDSARTFNTLERDALIGLAMMEKDLMNELPIHAIAFEGAPDSVKLPALLRTAEGMAVGSVEYSFDEHDRTLVRRERSCEGADLRTERLMENLKNIALTYFSLQKGDDKNAKVTWKEMDAPVTNFPGKVVVALLLSDADRKFEITRTVILAVK